MSWQKRKGTRFENLIVSIAENCGFKAKRAWASDGRSLGMHSEVDVIIYPQGERSEPWKIQAKCRKSIADYLKPNENVDWQIVKEDRGKTYAVIELEEFLKLLNRRT